MDPVMGNSRPEGHFAGWLLLASLHKLHAHVAAGTWSHVDGDWRTGVGAVLCARHPTPPSKARSRAGNCGNKKRAERRRCRRCHAHGLA
eukprot:3992373-Alexandrium_andersonii.AAC.1